jgi:RAQPRD family integrative conjugative element protein
MKSLKFTGLILVLIALLAPRVAFSEESEDESRYLIAIANEIENVKALAEKAEVNTDIKARTRFDYEALQRDLEQMQSAIERHAKEPSRTPRAVAALQENYTRKVNDE